MSLSSRTRIGLYEILAQIGAGGMGNVCRVQETNVRRRVAIKVPPNELAQGAEKFGGFQREAQVPASFSARPPS